MINKCRNRWHLLYSPMGRNQFSLAHFCHPRELKQLQRRRYIGAKWKLANLPKTKPYLIFSWSSSEPYRMRNQAPHPPRPQVYQRRHERRCWQRSERLQSAVTEWSQGTMLPKQSESSLTVLITKQMRTKRRRGIGYGQRHRTNRRETCLRKHYQRRT